MIVYACWPWNVTVPKSRKPVNDKIIVIVTSSGAPEMLVRLFGSAWSKPLKTPAKYTWGSKKTKMIHIGKAAMTADQKLDDRHKKKLREAAKIFLK